MDSTHEDRFLVFLRSEKCDAAFPERVERPLASCASYAEAQRVRRAHHDHAIDCVIRYVGPAGGGD
jgi:hypothetical protein